MEINKIYNENCLTGLKKLPDNIVDCCVTSPPYFGLRDYGTDEQIGLENTPELFIGKLVEVFNEVQRVLKPTGTLWLNLGDSYASTGGKYDGQNNQSGVGAKRVYENESGKSGVRIIPLGLKQKDLIGIPWMAAFALRANGWYLRQDIIWHKPNPMPESVTDRCTKSHEYIFLLSKSIKYYYDADAIKTPIADASVQRLLQDVENQKGSDRVPGKTNGAMKAVRANGIVTDRLLNYDSKEKELRPNVKRGGFEKEADVPLPDCMANKKSVWTVTTRPYSEAHFATFPERLIIDCIKAGCPEGGTVLDPFMGAGTTALVARKLNRNYIGFELNPAYIQIAEQRLKNELGMFI
jgi:DNA modification methylase